MQIDYTIAYPSGTLRKAGVIFPMDASNADYQAYAAWVAAGNGPIAIDDPVAPPTREHLSATPFKIRQALNAVGLRQQIEDFVANCNDQGIKDAWEYSTEWSSDSPLIAGAIAALGMTDDQVYSLFELAKTL